MGRRKGSLGFGMIDYGLESLESVSHGDIGHVGGDAVLLAEGLEVSPGEGVEIHGEFFLLSLRKRLQFFERAKSWEWEKERAENDYG